MDVLSQAYLRDVSRCAWCVVQVYATIGDGETCVCQWVGSLGGAAGAKRVDGEGVLAGCRHGCTPAGALARYFSVRLTCLWAACDHRRRRGVCAANGYMIASYYFAPTHRASTCLARPPRPHLRCGRRLHRRRLLGTPPPLLGITPLALRVGGGGNSRPACACCTRATPHGPTVRGRRPAPRAGGRAGGRHERRYDAAPANAGEGALNNPRVARAAVPGASLREGGGEG